MIILTVQPKSILPLLLAGYSVHPDDTKILECHKDVPEFISAYNWMTGQMMDKGITEGKSTGFPFWGWRRFDGRDGITILKSTEWNTECYCFDATETCILELSIPDNEILLSDFDLWHFVLNNSYLNNAQTDEEWEEKDNWFDSLPKKKQENEKLKSWKQVLDIDQNDLTVKYIQGTFWSIKPEYVLSIIQNT